MDDDNRRDSYDAADRAAAERRDGLVEPEGVNAGSSDALRDDAGQAAAADPAGGGSPQAAPEEPDAADASEIRTDPWPGDGAERRPGSADR